MRIPYANVLVSRNPMESIPKAVGVHEIQLLEAVHGAQAVTIVSGALHVIERDGLSPADEFERIKKLYGVDPERATTWAEIVYGRAGVKGMMREIDKALAEYDGSPAPVAVDPLSMPLPETATTVDPFLGPPIRETGAFTLPPIDEAAEI